MKMNKVNKTIKERNNITYMLHLQEEEDNFITISQDCIINDEIKFQKRIAIPDITSITEKDIILMGTIERQIYLLFETIRKRIKEDDKNEYK